MKQSFDTHTPNLPGLDPLVENLKIWEQMREKPNNKNENKSHLESSALEGQDHSLKPHPFVTSRNPGTTWDFTQADGCSPGIPVCKQLELQATSLAVLNLLQHLPYNSITSSTEMWDTLKYLPEYPHPCPFDLTREQRCLTLAPQLG